MSSEASSEATGMDGEESETKHPRYWNPSKVEKLALTERNALKIPAPFPILADQFVEVRIGNMDEYFKDIRRSFIRDANRGTLDAADFISEENFIRVCRYVTRCRVDRVFNIFCGRNQGFANLFPHSSLAMPESLIKTINRIGVVTVQGGAYRVCPKPEYQQSGIQRADWVNEGILKAFTNQFVSTQVGGIRLFKHCDSFHSIKGSSWWFMTARSDDDPNVLAKHDAATVVVYATHKEWMEGDRTLCAEIKNQFDGMIPVERTLKYTLGTFQFANLPDTPPGPLNSEQHVVFEVRKMDAYFAALRRPLVSAVQQYSRTPDRPDMISEANFISVCRWIIAGRVTRVYEGYYSFRRSSTLLPEPYVPVPKALCEIINGIGVVRVHNGDFSIVPKPESERCDPPSIAAMREFTDLIDAARSCGFITTSTISESINGSSWWLLSARSPSNPDVIAVQADKVTVYGSHKEWTVLDGLHCALVQNQFDGILPSEKTLKWCIGTFYNIPALQNFCNLPENILRSLDYLRTILLL